MTAAFVYPGQGSQAPGMLSELPDTPEVRQTIAEAGMAALDSTQSLGSTAGAQLALLVGGVAAARALAARGAFPGIVAGHSVGAFGAAVAAGALEFEEAVAAVAHRARLMASLFPSGYGMLALSGLRESTVRTITEQVSGTWLANINSYDQIVLAGEAAALDQARSLAARLGASRADRLAVVVPSHGPALAPVTASLRELLSGIPPRKLTARYIMISTARPARTSADVLDDLAVSVSRTVRWRDVVGVIGELGTRFILQLPPGHVLVRLAQSDLARYGSNAGVEVRAMSEARLDDSVARVRRFS
jgi:malonate decarboxylase epsilon subunit